MTKTRKTLAGLLWGGTVEEVVAGELEKIVFLSTLRG
jgi:hypothetical protein